MADLSLDAVQTDCHVQKIMKNGEKMKTVFKVKRQCSVPGCAEIECYSISKGSGGSVCLCRRCASELLEAMTASDKKVKACKKSVKREEI